MSNIPKRLSKKKYQEYKSFLEEEYGTKISLAICSKFCEIFEFDPDKKLYDERNKLSHDKWRKKKAEEFGVSLSRVNKGIKSLILEKSDEVKSTT